MDHVAARAFVNSWVTAWNAHDLDAVLMHFADDVTFRSPVAVQLMGGDGVIRGQEALRGYWAEGLRRIPDLRFEVLGSEEATGTPRLLCHRLPAESGGSALTDITSRYQLKLALGNRRPLG